MTDEKKPIVERSPDPELLHLRGPAHYLQFWPFHEVGANDESLLRDFFKKKMELSEVQFQLLLRLLGTMTMNVWFGNGDGESLPTITLNVFLGDVCTSTDLINLIDEGLSDAQDLPVEEELYAARKLRDLLDRVIKETEDD